MAANPAKKSAGPYVLPKLTIDYLYLCHLLSPADMGSGACNLQFSQVTAKDKRALQGFNLFEHSWSLLTPGQFIIENRKTDCVVESSIFV